MYVRTYVCIHVYICEWSNTYPKAYTNSTIYIHGGPLVCIYAYMYVYMYGIANNDSSMNASTVSRILRSELRYDANGAAWHRHLHHHIGAVVPVRYLRPQNALHVDLVRTRLLCMLHYIIYYVCMNYISELYRRYLICLLVAQFGGIALIHTYIHTYIYIHTCTCVYTVQTYIHKYIHTYIERSLVRANISDEYIQFVRKYVT